MTTAPQGGSGTQIPGATGQLHAFTNGKQQRAVTPGSIEALFIVQRGINPAQCEIQTFPGLAEGNGVVGIAIFPVCQEGFFSILGVTVEPRGAPSDAIVPPLAVLGPLQVEPCAVLAVPTGRLLEPDDDLEGGYRVVRRGRV